MHLIARLDEATLREILDELLPVTILLDDGAAGGPGGRDGRWVRIEPSQHLDFIADEGLRLRTGGQIRWLTAGVPVEATLHSVQVMLRPEVLPEKHGGKLRFRPELESVDVKNVPAFIDRGILALVNRQLSARADEMVWNFGQSLGLAVPLPPLLEGVSTLQLDARNASVQITDHAIELGLTLSLHFLRKPGTT